MGIINQLSIEVSNKIAAGEVVERPQSVVKELVENAIDAGADVISVEIENGGVSFLRVTDNGSGMSEEDAKMCFQRHATSKIKTAADLEKIYTLGFRGEALSSICAVSEMELYTKRREDETGTAVITDCGSIISAESRPAADGTTMVVKNLFKNVPARLKFLKKDATEAGYISDIMIRFILSHPEISFRFIKDKKEQFFTPGDNDIKNAVYSVYGREYAKAAPEIDYEYNGIRVTGVIGKSETARANRSYQSFFVNNRYIKSAMLTRAAEEAYKGQIMIGKFPMFALNLEIDAGMVDINVHPTKLEAKFSNEQDVYRAVYHAVKNELYKTAYIPEIERVKPKEEEPFTIPKPDIGSWKEAPMPHQRGAFAQYEKPKGKNPNAFRLNITKPESDSSSGWDSYNIKPPVYQEIKPQREQIILKEKPEESIKQEEIPTPISDAEYFMNARMNINNVPDVKETVLRQEEIKVTAGEIPSDIKIIGQLFKTYIIAEEGDSMLIVDQHAAHERVMYERVKEQLEERRVYAQSLIIPIPVDMTDNEKEVFKEHEKELDDMGFELERSGDDYAFTAAPDTLDEDTLISVFIELITAFSDGKEEIIDAAKDRLIKTIACKAAIKANRETGEKEMAELIRQVKALENINTCPHGRPIIIKMTKKELEKEFGRTL